MIKALLSFAPEVQTAGHAALSKGTFCFIVYFANIYFDMIELTEKIFFVSSEMPVPVLFLCSHVLYPGLL